MDVENNWGLVLVTNEDEKLDVDGNDVMATTATANANADFMIVMRYTFSLGIFDIGDQITSLKLITDSNNGVSLRRCRVCNNIVTVERLLCESDLTSSRK